MRKIISMLIFISTQLLFSQVGINTPNANATLDVVAKTTDGSMPEGIIAPRLTGNQIKAGDASYTAAQRGTLIYATAAVGTPSTKTVNITSQGYYYFDGNIWQKIINTDANTNIYNSNGTLLTDRVVTMADKTLDFTSNATAGTSHFQIDGTTFNVDALNNRIGLGIAAPTTRLHINNATPGAIRIVDGTQGAGKVLVSDANGVATWGVNTDTNTNIYNSNGTLATNRVVTMADKTLDFTSNATTGTSHFQVDGTTLNVDAVNNRIGVGVAAPTNRLHINNGNTPGAIRIVDGTQGAGKILVSDANGVGTWRESSGAATVINSTVGNANINIATAAGTFSYTGANALVTTPGYYIISPRVATDKSPAGCGNFLAYNLSKAPNASTNVAFPQQDIHMPSGSGVFDFIYTSNIAYLTAGRYYLRVRRGDGCSYNRTRTNAGQNSFTLTLLK